MAPNVSVAAADLAKARARRLTAQEIQNSVRDVFFATDPLAVPPLTEGKAKGFALYDDYAVTLDFYTALQAFSESVSAVVAPRLLSSNCGSGAAACVADVDGPVLGAVELSQRLSMSSTVKSCYVASVMQYLLGRPVQVPHQRTHVDQQTIDSFLSGTFNTGNMLAVLKSAILSDPAYLRDATDLPL